MHKAIPRYLQIATGLLIVSGYAALSSVPEYGARLLLWPLAVLAAESLALRLDARYRAYRQVTNIISALFILSLFYFWSVFRLIDTVLLVVVYVQTYKMWHQKTPRDYAQIFLMAFFMVLGACSLLPEAGIGPALLLFGLTALPALVLLEMYGALVGLATHETRKNLELGVDVRRVWPDRLRGQRLGRIGWTMGLTALALTIAVFVLLPRIEAGALGRSNVITAATGTPSEVSLGGAATDIAKDETIVLRAEFPDLPEGAYPDELYWRIHPLNYFTSDTWTAISVSHNFDDQRARVRFGADGGTLFAASAGFDDRVLVRQHLFLEDPGAEGVPILATVRQVADASTALAWNRDSDFSVVRIGGRHASFYCTAWSDTRQPTPEVLRNCPETYRAVMGKRDYFLLTNAEVEPRTRTLAQDLTRNAPTAYDKALAVQQYLEGPGFLYSLSVPALPGRYAVDAFIHDARVGHCELYASAMALMLRSIGIPSRVVQGYRGGEWSDADRAYLVRRSMAHLWVEVYFVDQGWVRFDPSPLGELESTGNAMFRAAMRQVHRARMLWFRNVVGYQGITTWSRLQNTAMGWLGMPGALQDRPRAEVATGAVEGARQGAPVTVFVTLGGLLAVAGGLTWRRWRRQRRLGIGARLSADQARAAHAYRVFLGHARRAGLEPSGKTAGEVLAQVHAWHWPAAEEVAAFLNDYEAVRFGLRPLSAADSAALIRRAKALVPSRRTRKTLSH